MEKEQNFKLYMDKIKMILNRDSIDFNKEIYYKEEEINIKRNLDKESIDLCQVSELQFHKIAYFCYGYFWKKFHKELFSANFEAWKYGPVEKNYREKKKVFLNLLTHDEEEFLNKLIERLLQYNVWVLVKESHLTAPWINHKNKYYSQISNSEIKAYFNE